MYRSDPPLAGLLAAATTAILAVVACSPGHATAASQSGHRASSARFTVTSTLDGLSSLPHRIHWQAFPKPSAKVTQVDFLIDGKAFWVEHVTPYYYGGDGNYLVTTFLAPGPHAFTVRAVNAGGHTATDTVTASVPIAKQPPTALTGTWRRYSGQPNSGSCNPGPCPPAGYWRLVIS